MQLTYNKITSITKKSATHVLSSLDLLEDGVEDERERHLVVVVQQRVDRLLQPHQLVLFLQ